MTSTQQATGILAPNYTYRIAFPDNREYAQLSALIERVYAKAYGAEVVVNYSQLLGVYGSEGTPHAALGMRSAAEQSLFLETYLDRPAEKAIAQRTGHHYARRAIAEAGNLASTRMTALRDLMFTLSVTLKQEGFEYILFTGTESLKRYLELLGLKPVVYADADPTKLGTNATRWGRYYDTEPKVMGGTVNEFYRGLIGAYGQKEQA